MPSYALLAYTLGPFETKIKRIETNAKPNKATLQTTDALDNAREEVCTGNPPQHKFRTIHRQ